MEYEDRFGTWRKSIEQFAKRMNEGDKVTSLYAGVESAIMLYTFYTNLSCVNNITEGKITTNEDYKIAQ